MKLIYCPNCGDIRKLAFGHINCFCGLSGGFYHEDGLHATVTGHAIPLGIANSTFLKALSNRPEEGMGSDFTAFVIPKECPTVELKSDFLLDTNP